MKHVVVGSSGDLSSNQIISAIINNRLTGNSLHSLIDGLKGENIDSESIGRTANKIEDYRRLISLPAGADIYIDSGGYSFIKGELAPGNLDLAISLFQSFLQLKSEYYDYIFSLDIPYSLKFEHFNTKKNIYEYNRKSLEQSIHILKENLELADKFHLIYHFKTIDHYEIFQKVFSELSIHDFIKHRAIGGMVSLKKIAGIQIAPFIATSYQCLWDYENSILNGEEFRIHFLGISVAYDRFIIAFMECLFQSYLGVLVPVTFTYDTIKFKRSAMYEQKHICEFDGATLQAHKPLAISDSLYRQIYSDRVNMIDRAKKVLIRKANGEEQENQQDQPMTVLSPLTISSELAVDRFFEHIIEKHQMVDLLLTTRNIVYFKHDFKKALIDAFDEYHKIFGKNMLNSIMESMTHVYKFHRWYTLKHNVEGLDQLSRKFITRDINFPARLN